jgi:hypothetical protein
VYSDWWKDGAKRSRRPGVWYHGREERNGEEVRVDEWLCGPLYLEASTADCRGENFGLLLRFRDRHDRWHTWNMPMRLLRGSGEELRGELLSLGLDLEPSGMRKRLHPYLVHRVPERRVNAALQVGWHDDTFVLPDRAFGPDAADVYFQSESASTADFSSRVAKWRTVLLSSGEKTVEAHQVEARRQSRAGQSVRLLDIPISATHGAFDDLHGHESGRHLADTIKTACDATTAPPAARSWSISPPAPGPTMAPCWLASQIGLGPMVAKKQERPVSSPSWPSQEKSRPRRVSPVGGPARLPPLRWTPSAPGGIGVVPATLSRGRS